MRTYSCLGLVFALCLFLQAPVWAGGSREYNSVSTTESFRGFSRMEVHSAIRLELKQGKTWSVQVEASNSDRQKLLIQQQGATLILGVKPLMFIRLEGEVTVKVTLPALESLSLNGASSGRIFWQGGEDDRIALDLNGSSSLSGTLEAGYIQARINGASKMNLEGGAERIDFELNGASGFTGSRFECSQARLVLNGASQALLAVRDKLWCQANGASRLEYSGNPRLDQELSGASTIRKL